VFRPWREGLSGRTLCKKKPFSQGRRFWHGLGRREEVRRREHRSSENSCGGYKFEVGEGGVSKERHLVSWLRERAPLRRTDWVGRLRQFSPKPGASESRARRRAPLSALNQGDVWGGGPD